MNGWEKRGLVLFIFGVVGASRFGIDATGFYVMSAIMLIGFYIFIHEYKKEGKN